MSKLDTSSNGSFASQSFVCFRWSFSKLFKKLGHSPTRHLFRKIIGISTTTLSCFSTHSEEFPHLRILDTTVVSLEVLPANSHVIYIYISICIHVFICIHIDIYIVHIYHYVCAYILHVMLIPPPLGSNFKVLRLLTAHLFAETPSPPSTMSSLWRFMSPWKAWKSTVLENWK